MKKIILGIALVGASLIGFQQHANAQRRGTSYENGLGLFIDAGNGGTYVGPHLKHYFNENDAGQVNLLFGNNTTVLGVEYSYNEPIDGANGLKWNIGIGPQVEFYSHDHFNQTNFSIRPMAGLEYKVPGAPVALGFDWRPWWTLTHGSNFEAARFGIGFKYAF